MSTRKDPIISVIVTVHNAEKYLRECLNSVTSQTFPHIEILCMDGGSTDQSPQILKEYAARDGRIRIMNDANTSYGHKINEGIRQASGEYIAVLESDDMYCLDMLERLYTIAERYRPDYVNADYLNFYDFNGKRYQILVKMYPQEDYGKLLECGRHPEKMRQILRYWTGLFRRDFLLRNEIRMNESPGASFQDMSFRFLTSALADTAYHLDVPVYLYRTDNPDSSVYDPKKAVVIADEFNFLKKELVKRNIKNQHIWLHFYTWKYNDFYGNLLRFGNEERKALFHRCYQELETDRNVLLSFDSLKYSNAVYSLLKKSKEEVWDDINNAYIHIQLREQWEKNFLINLCDNKVIIFGCGIRGKNALNYLESIGLNQTACFLTDNSEVTWNHEINGYSILSPYDAMNKYPDALYLIAVKNHESEIRQQLQHNGIKESQIYIFQ